LARALYSDSDIYLFDDPLSAVDPEVANSLFNGCIKEFLKNKLRVLVTHQLQFLKDCDKILILEEGRA
jgi:ATP-binding cassette subfamily C (CFTR/MRP) protein 4